MWDLIVQFLIIDYLFTLIRKEKEVHLPTPQDGVFETIFPRVSCDKAVVNQTGRLLIEKCVDNQLFILNGRTLGDSMG